MEQYGQIKTVAEAQAATGAFIQNAVRSAQERSFATACASGDKPGLGALNRAASPFVGRRLRAWHSRFSLAVHEPLKNEILATWIRGRIFEADTPPKKADSSEARRFSVK